MRVQRRRQHGEATPLDHLEAVPGQQPADLLVGQLGEPPLAGVPAGPQVPHRAGVAVVLHHQDAGVRCGQRPGGEGQRRDQPQRADNEKEERRERAAHRVGVCYGRAAYNIPSPALSSPPLSCPSCPKLKP